MEANRIEIQGEFRGANDNKFEFVISNETVDRHGTIFMADGWDLANYRKNPVVVYNHDRNNANPDTIIGTSEVRLEGKELIATVTFEDAENNPLAGKVRSKVENGILRSASIGAIPQEGAWEVRNGEDVLVFTRQELLEWSIVSVPSNTDAVKRGYEDVIKSIEKPTEERNQKGMTILEAQLLINKQ
tara:strand:- start:46 stop:606 length:561 start_codon:yes stop_codon:yes gene_type:complete